MLEILLALVAGILTIAAPCILLPLPIILGASVGQQGHRRPIFITLGFVVSFAVLGLTLNIIVQNSGLDPQILRNVAAILLLLFGFFMLWPVLFERFTSLFSGVINRAGEKASTLQNNGSGFLLGIILGIIWTPCAGPILASILTLIAQQTDIARASLLLLAYAVGAGIPMLIIAYGGQTLTTNIKAIARHAATLQKIFGVIIMAVAVAVYFQYDTVLQAKILDFFDRNNMMIPITTKETSSPNQKSVSKVPLQDYGQAPELTGITNWLNSEPLTLESLRGKVVLVDFMTYSCINCVRTFPHINAWHEKYKDQGLVIIGVHTPEFAFEKETRNVQKALDQFNIKFPVAQDNDYATWNAYANRYWPAKYLIDKEGTIVYTHFGEGSYQETENIIRQLLELDQMTEKTAETVPYGVGSPEMYFGLERMSNLSSEQTALPRTQQYTFPTTIDLNTFALEGEWQFNDESVKLISQTGKIKLRFAAGKVFMVASAPTEPQLKILVDGTAQEDVAVTTSKLYTLFNSTDNREHEIEIQITGKDFEAFTFTFGS